MAKSDPTRELPPPSDVWTDLGLTLPIFVLYHLGVVFLPVRNAVDPVTSELKALANQSLPLYAGLTLAVGAAFIMLLWIMGRKNAFNKSRFLLMAVEGSLYAVLMKFAAGYVVGSLSLAKAPLASDSLFSMAIMSLGAGFYEEIAFRVGLFGIGALIVKTLLKGVWKVVGILMWALAAACIFSAWHYVGALGDHFALESFLFRAVCGLFLTLVFTLRGFAPAVWTHALYDVWVLVFR